MLSTVLNIGNNWNVYLKKQKPKKCPKSAKIKELGPQERLFLNVGLGLSNGEFWFAGLDLHFTSFLDPIFWYLSQL